MEDESAGVTCRSIDPVSDLPTIFGQTDVVRGMIGIPCDLRDLRSGSKCPVTVGESHSWSNIPKKDLSCVGIHIGV